MHLPHIEHCILCKQYVRLDQEQEECAREHRCQSTDCPLKGYFHFVTDPGERDSGTTHQPARRK